jgi:hypothetical protein
LSDHDDKTKSQADPDDLTNLTVEKLAAIAKFVQQVGGVEKARLAIQTLADKAKQAA